MLVPLDRYECAWDEKVEEEELAKVMQMKYDI